MTTHRQIAALALTACLVVLPLKGSADTVMGNRLLSAPPSLTHVQHSVRPKVATPVRAHAKVPRFDWMANGAANRANGKAVPARYRVIPGKGTWICSPAGFGQGSRCYAG